MTITQTLRTAALLSLFCLALPPGTGAARAQTTLPSAGAGRGVQLAEHAFSRGDPLPDWVDRITRLPAAVQGVPLAVRLADVQFHVAGESTAYMHRALTANEPGSLAALGQYEISFQPEYQRVQLHSLRILRDGQELDRLGAADIRFLQRETSLDQGVYSGSITAAIVTEDVRVGDTLELSYSIIGQNPVFNGKFFDAAMWDSPAPVALRRVTLDTPERRNIFHHVVGDPQGAVRASEQHHDGRRILRFETRDLPARIGEPYVPADVPVFRWIQFSEFTNWRELDLWAQGLFDAPTAAADLQEALRPALAARTPQEAVAKVLEFVQNDIRYLSIAMGENSHRPFTPAQVLQRRYGDCKDKTLLMVTMLRQLGVEARPVLLSTYAKKGLDHMLPSPTLFDHAIVRARVQGKLYFFDPTRLGQYGALDRMGQAHGGAQVLTVGAGSGALETIALPADVELYTDRRSEHVTVTSLDQPAELQTRIQYAGLEAENARAQLAGMSTQQLRKAYEASMGRRYAEFTLLADPAVDDDRVNNRLSIALRYSIAKFLEKDDKGWLMRYKPVNLTEQFYVPDLARREHPLQVPSYPGVHDYEFQVTLPEQVDARYEPSQRTVATSAFSLTEALSFAGREARARLRLDVTADRVAAQDMVAYMGGTRKMNEMLQGSLYLKQTMLKAPAAPAYKEGLQNQLEARLKATSRVLADAALTGQDPGSAWCERARLYSSFGRHEEALKDAAQALRQQAQSQDSLICHGEVSFAAGNYKDSAADYGRAAALGGADSATWLHKGWADLYLGNQRDALADLARAGEHASDPLTRVRAAIWLAVLGAPADSTVADGKLIDELWLNQALEMFRNQQTPDQMLRQVSHDSGANLDSRLVEAYFYAGKFYLLRQDKLRARVYFQRALDKGALLSSYHTLARLELARLQ